MEDRDIVTLYWQRDEEAIRQTDRQYGRYLSAIAFHILADREDSRETVNDTYLRAWGSMPAPPAPGAVHLSGPYHPAAVHRPLAGPGPGEAVGLRRVPGGAGGLRIRPGHAGGGPGPAGAGPGRGRLSPDAAASRPPAFLCRYYYADSLAETARVCGISVPAVKSQLYRTRQGLRTYLEKEGFDV